MTFRVGFGKADITVFEPGMCMFGWGQPENVARGVAGALTARAVVVESLDSRRRIAYVCAELGFVSQHLQQRVIALVRERGLGLDEHDLMLTATHTHSGPNGYSTYLFYGVTGPGFSTRVVEGLARGIVAAIEAALAARTPARLWLQETSVPLAEPVAWNRSLAAYNANEDVARVGRARADEAVDRRLVVLRADDERGRPLGLVCWFPVHGTSIHHDNTLIHPDNKGVAARRCEELVRERFEGARDFVAIFAQEAAGDVSPNYRWSKRRGLLVGSSDDDFESADAVGSAQARHAFRAFLDARERGEELGGVISSRIHYRDFTRLAVDPEFAGGREGQTTTTACLGFGFAYGTREGPGPAAAIRGINPALTRIVEWRRAKRRADWRTMHGPKVRFFDLGHGANGKVMKLLPALPPGFGLLRDPRVVYYRNVFASGWLRARPWVPQVLPAQLFRVGALAIVGIPAEPTTVSGRRLRAAAMGALAAAGVRKLIVNGYANAYAAYVTTHEEYQLQLYEGASTLFGRWTLGAWCTEIRRLAREDAAGLRRRGTGDAPLRFAEDDLPPSA